MSAKRFLTLGVTFLSGSAVGILIQNITVPQQKKASIDSTDFSPVPLQPHVNVSNYPIPTVGEQVKYYDNYILSYDRRFRTARWVFEHLTPQSLLADDNSSNGVSYRKDMDFYPDIQEDAMFAATNIDYKGSGYDRGHLAAAGNYRNNPQYCQNTFVLSNIAPQVGAGFNRDAWNNLEKYVRAIARTNKNVYVCTGPLYLPKQENNRMFVKYEVIGPNQVAVPTHFFKVVVIETHTGQYDLLSYVMPNTELPSNVDLNNFLVPIEMIEKASGLKLFHGLPRFIFSQINKTQSFS